jgi:hypothetical protein
MSTFTYDPPRKNCTTIIFDLDETLINTQWFANGERMSMPTKKTKHKWTSFAGAVLVPQRYPRHTSCFLDTTNTGLIHTRPYVFDLLNFCFEHFNVAFWSTATKGYVRNIVLRLLYAMQRQPSEAMFVWASTREPSAESASFVDVFSGKRINKSTRQHPTHDSAKELGYVFDRFPDLSKEHTFLVDNLPTHMVLNNPEHVVYLPPFSYLNADDTILRKVLGMMKTALRTPLAAKKREQKEKKDAKKKKEKREKEEKEKQKKEQKGQKAQKAPKSGKPIANETTTTTTTEEEAAAEEDPRFQPLLLKASALRPIAFHSPTNDGVVYPGGYVGDFRNVAYAHPSGDSWTTNQAVVIPYNGKYMRGTIKKLFPTSHKAAVRLTLKKDNFVFTPAAANTKRKRKPKAETVRVTTALVPYGDLVATDVGTNIAFAYGLY